MSTEQKIVRAYAFVQTYGAWKNIPKLCIKGIALPEFTTLSEFVQRVEEFHQKKPRAEEKHSHLHAVYQDMATLTTLMTRDPPWNPREHRSRPPVISKPQPVDYDPNMKRPQSCFQIDFEKVGSEEELTAMYRSYQQEQKAFIENKKKESAYQNYRFELCKYYEAMKWKNIDEENEQRWEQYQRLLPLSESMQKTPYPAELKNQQDLELENVLIGFANQLEDEKTDQLELYQLYERLREQHSKINQAFEENKRYNEILKEMPLLDKCSIRIVSSGAPITVKGKQVSIHDMWAHLCGSKIIPNFEVEYEDLRDGEICRMCFRNTRELPADWNSLTVVLSLNKKLY